MFNHPNLFIRMVANALAGASLGLIAGLVFGFIILFISSYALPPFLEGDGPQQVAPFLGMGCGTLVGAFLGGLVGLKK
ncbi:hypothetical protein HYV70_02125 [Candidatus Uhrbacteria bacterium]|nr:hypothetical protein [Candidatus Uhrbacteria bacterium]